jgi:outer membrane protein
MLVAVVFVSASALSAQDTTWQIRVRGIGVIPNEEATITVIGGDVEVDNSYVPEVDFTFFFTPNVAAELILATSKHNAMAVGTTLGDVDLGSVWLLPPTLTLQYHLLPEGVVRPYIGAGGNLTFFYNVDVPGTVVTDADYSTAFGFALQAGADIALGDQGWFLNVDAKKIFLDTDVELNGASILADLTLDPWVIGVGFGYAFQ